MKIKKDPASTINITVRGGLITDLILLVLSEIDYRVQLFYIFVLLKYYYY